MPNETTPYDLGRRAYNEGEPISVIPRELETLHQYEEWRRGWNAAWQEDTNDEQP